VDVSYVRTTEGKILARLQVDLKPLISTPELREYDRNLMILGVVALNDPIIAFPKNVTVFCTRVSLLDLASL
jgi:hypothetical protein